MNNAFIVTEEETTEVVPKEIFRERVEFLTETIEAVSNIANSSYWKVLQKNVFDVDLAKAKSRLAKESNTTEIFRYQGEIRWGEKFDLVGLLQKYRDELTAIRKKLL